MASLSNINGLFDVHSTGAILFSTSHGANGQILKSNGNAAPTWVDPNTVGTGPWLPLAGGGVTGNLTVGGTLGITGAQTGTTATFTGLVSGITPSIAANFATKAYVDAHPGSGGTVTSVGGTGSVSGITLTGTVTTTGNLTLGGTLSASITNISDAARWWNNFGDNHSTRTGFDASTASYGFGWRYVQGNTNGPGTGGTQFYSAYVGLGNEYPSTGTGSYGAYLAFDRNVANPYLSIRYNENNALSTWRKISAGTADILTTARTIAGVSFNGSANISLNNNAITNGAGYTTNTGNGTVTSVATGNGLTGGTITSTGTLTMSGDYTGSLSVTGANLAGNSFSDPDIILSVTDEDTTASIRNKMTGSTAITKVSDATAPAPGCFQVNSSYYPQGFGPYHKISEGDEFIFELWIRYVSGAATYNLLYAGSNFYNAAGTYLGNSQRYWGESALNINANTGTGWYHVSGTLGPNRGSGTGDIPTTAESMRLLFLFNYAPNGTIVTNYCGLKVYKSNPTVTKLYRKTLGSEGGTSRNRDLVVDSNGDIHTSSVIAPVGMTLKVDTGNVSALTIDNVGSTTFSGYTYFPDYLFHTGDTNTRIGFTTGTVTLRGDTSILLDGPVTANSTVDISSTLTTSGQITALSSIYLKDRITLPASALSTASGRPGYAIYQESGAWTSPFPDLCIAMHTGIKFGAYSGYNGMRFYDDYTMATQVMSINNSSDTLGANNVYVTNSLQADSSLRAPIFYDSANTTYYGDFASTTIGKYFGRRAHAEGFQVGSYNSVGGNSAKTNPIYTIGSAYMPSDTALGSMYGVGYAHPNLWGSGKGSGWGMYIANNGAIDATIGCEGSVSAWFASIAVAEADFRAPIFYDSANTSYYMDPAGTSQVNAIEFVGSTNNAYWYGANQWGARLQTDSGYIELGPANSSYAHIYTDRPNFYMNTGLYIAGGSWMRTGDIRSAIFYDVNNTTYYGDFASTGTSLNVAGDVVAYASSDIRFKDNVIPISNPLDKIKQLSGYTFQWNQLSHKETDKKDIGVIAQEVEKVFPEIVDTRSSGYKAVDYSKLTALLIESIKEQQKTIEDLKSRIEKLEL